MNIAPELGLYSGPPVDDMKKAVQVSWDCPECHGVGITERWYCDTGLAEKWPTRSFPCYCHRCASGRLVKKLHENDAADVYDRISDLASRELEHLRAHWFRYKPDQREAMDGQATFDRRKISEMFKREETPA